jgi:hypothetical protein
MLELENGEIDLRKILRMGRREQDILPVKIERN